MYSFAQYGQVTSASGLPLESEPCARYSAVLKSTNGNSWTHIESLESAGTATDAIFVPLEDNNSRKGGSSGEDTMERSRSRAIWSKLITFRYIESRTRRPIFNKKERNSRISVTSNIDSYFTTI